MKDATGTIDLRRIHASLAYGDLKLKTHREALHTRLEVVPLRVCSCVNVFDTAYGVWDGRVDPQIRVTARGRML